jgi:uncharacterized protein (DUF302 family)
MKQFDYTVETGKGFDEAVSAVEAKSKEKGFTVLVVHDVKQRSNRRDFPESR